MECDGSLVEDQRLVRLLKQLKRLKGAHVFQYVDDDGKIHQPTPSLVNDYLRERTGRSVTAKDFRTWKASALAAGDCSRIVMSKRFGHEKRSLRSTIAEVADALGNTATVCRKYYIHAGLLEAFETGVYFEQFKRFAPRPKHQLTSDEVVLAQFLRHWEPSQTASI